MSDHLSRKLAGIRRNAESVVSPGVEGTCTATPPQPADSPICFQHRGLSIVTPVRYTPGYQYPLIVWLHSGGHNERQIEQVLPHVSVQNYVALGIRGNLALDLAGHCFDWSLSRSSVCSTLDAIEGAIGHVRETLNINTNRVFLAGYASGASMACRVALKAPTHFAGLIRMGGRFPRGNASGCDFHAMRRLRMPMLWQHAIGGRDDDSQRLRVELEQAMILRARVEVRQYRDTEVMNTVALRDINQWCFDYVITPRTSTQYPVDDSAAIFQSCFMDEHHSLVEFSTN